MAGEHQEDFEIIEGKKRTAFINKSRIKKPKPLLGGSLNYTERISWETSLNYH